MKELRTEITIDAPVADVWRVLTDFAAYPDWNPFVRSIEGKLAIGAPLKVLLGASGSRTMTFKPTVTKLKPLEEFRWLGSLFFPGIFDGEHIFELQAKTPETTLFTQREEFNGFLVSLILGRTGADTRRGFEEMNAALKARAESGIGDSAGGFA
ncbi:MAG: SRPBCC domain-containing protein [Caldilineales bacterium]|nr:SRPBCC domain-containing protein [Caldilineales bacterium]